MHLNTIRVNSSTATLVGIIKVINFGVKLNGQVDVSQSAGPPPSGPEEGNEVS